MSVHWDPTINLGTVMAVAAILWPLLKGIRMLSQLTLKVDLMWASWLKAREGEALVK